MKTSLTTRCLFAVALAVPIGLGLGYLLRENNLAGSSSPDNARAAELDHLYVAADKLNFGEVCEDKEFKWVLPIENRGTQPVEVASFISGCSCAAINPKSLRLRPGEGSSVELTLDLTLRRPNSQDLLERDFQVRIAAVTHLDVKKRNREHEWLIVGKVKKLFHFSNDTVIDAGRHSVRSQPIPPQSLVFSTFARLDELHAVSNSRHFLASLTEKPATSVRAYELKVSQSSTLEVGNHVAEIRIAGKSPTGQTVAAKLVLVVAEFTEDIQATPPAIQLGAREWGETCEECITLASCSGAAFNVDSFKAGGPHLSVQKISSSDLGARQSGFLVRQLITGTGPQTNKVLFSIRESDGRKSEIVVPIRFHGLER